MRQVVLWERVGGIGLEYACFDFSQLNLEGDIVLFDGGLPWSVSYRVEFDDTARTRSASIRVKRAGKKRECNLSRTSDGEWSIDGTAQPQLHGIADIDLSITPSTNTAPIRRLALRPGFAAEVTAVWVRFPDLEAVPLRQTYRCIASNRYQYEAAELDFSTRLDCDENGIVRTYHGLWRAVNA